MDIDVVSQPAASGETRSAAAAGQSDADRQQIKRLAQEFEALLMTQMLREMRHAMLTSDYQQNGFGAGPLTDTGDAEFGRALSRAGGLGLADVLLRAFERQLGGASGSRPAASSTVNAAAAAQAPDRGGARETGTPQGPASPTGRSQDAVGSVSNVQSTAAGQAGDWRVLTEDSASAPVSSGFGWRHDPFAGTPRFHTGLDIAVAYGRDVRATADGTVVFSGVQGGYGQTVVVEHGAGRQTRYAHLSEQFVRAGDTVAGGQVLGKTGDSGRATGPHLHFEVLVNGHPVDPSALDGD